MPRTATAPAIRTRHRAALVLGGLLLAVWGASLAALAPLLGDPDDDPIAPGTEPAAASGPDGATAVTWADVDDDGSGVYATLFDAAGAVVRPPFLVNSTTAGEQDAPDVAFLSDGTIVVVWESDASGVEQVRGQLLDTAGFPVGGEFPVNAVTTADHLLPAVLAESGGEFAVAWAGETAAPPGFAHFARRFDGLAAPLGIEEQFGATATATPPGLSVRADGEHLAVWHDEAGAIRGVRLDPTVMPIGSEFRIDAASLALRTLPAPATHLDGTYTVVWQSDGQDGSGAGVFARRVGGSMPIGSELQVNATTLLDQARPAVAVDAAGDLLVTWQGGVAVGAEVQSIFARRVRLDPPLTPIGSELQVNLGLVGTQEAADVALDPARDFLVVWQGDEGSPGTTTVFARRELLRLFADGFESADLSAWTVGP